MGVPEDANKERVVGEEGLMPRGKPRVKNKLMREHQVFCFRQNRQVFHKEAVSCARAPQGTSANGTFLMPLGGGCLSVLGSTLFFVFGYQGNSENGGTLR